MKKDERNIAIYSRKSKFSNKGESIENQVGLCREYIRLNYGQELAESALIYEDEGFSGGNIERPQFKEMIKNSREKKLSMIICYRLDRISRNISDFACLIEELDDLDISLVSLKERFDTASPMGRAMMYITSIFSQLERETIADRIQDNMYELAKTGRWLGGVTPTVYSSERIEKITMNARRKELCKLTIIQEEIELVKLIFSLFIETASISKTIAYLTQKNYRTKNDRYFTRASLKNILMNPVYMIVDNAAYHYWLSRVDLYADNTDFDGCHGIAVFNRTLQKPGRAHSMRAMDDWIVTVGKHKGVISGQDWIKVQEILEQNRSLEFSKPRSEVALLTGFLCCAECGSPMRSKLSKRKNAAGERIYSYICSSKDKGGNVKCTMKAANGIDLDAEIIESIKKLSGNTEFMKRLKQNININSDTRNRDLIYSLDLFHSNYDNLNMVHKRNILHSLVKEAIWDGEQMLISFLY